MKSRPGWTWYVPIRLRQDEAGALVAQPLPLRSFSVRIAAQADGYVVMDECDDTWQAGSVVTVQRFRSGGEPL